MSHGCVTLDEVFAAAGIRAASTVPETSGYLALAVGDATSRLPFLIDDRMVMLTTEGNVGITKRGEVLPPRQAAANLRAILARLLAVSTGTAMPSLTAAARPHEESDRGVDAVIEEIEAALIPVNRAAARRALARLARETIKAKESGRLRRASARPAARAAAPQGPTAASPEIPEPPAPVIVAAPPPAPVIVAAPPPAPNVAVPPPPAPTIAVAPPPDIEAPAPASAAETEHVADAALTPPPENRDPTPTLIGMAPIEVEIYLSPFAPPALAAAPPEQHDEPLPASAPSAPCEAASATPASDVTVAAPAIDVAAAPTPTGFPESTVLAQPTEDPRLAFLAITPSFAVEAAPPPRGLPATRPAPESPVPVAPAAACSTRADDLLARFGASCVDEEGMRNAAACLRRIAGVDPTPPPPERVQIRLPEPPPPAPSEPLVTLPPDFWTGDETRRLPRRGFAKPRLGLALLALVVGLAGGAATVRLRPDLLGALPGASLSPAGKAEAPSPAVKKEAPPPPAATEPAGQPAPTWNDRLGGTRAERGSELFQRAR